MNVFRKKPCIFSHLTAVQMARAIKSLVHRYFVEDEVKRKLCCEFCGATFHVKTTATRLRNHLLRGCKKISADIVDEVVSEYELQKDTPEMPLVGAKREGTSKEVTWAKKRRKYTQTSILAHSHGPIPQWSIDQFWENMVFGMAAHAVPFRWFSSKWLVKGVHALAPTFPPCTYKKLMSYLDRTFVNSKEKIMAKLERTSHVCIASDSWTSKKRETLVNFILCSCEWKRPIFWCAVNVSEDIKDGELLKTVFERLFATVGKDRIVGIVSDRGSSFAKAKELLSADQPHIITYACAAHMFHGVTEAVATKSQTVGSCLQFCEDIVAFFRRVLPRAVLRKVLAEEKGKTSQLLPSPVGWTRSRWGSAYLCVSSVVNTKEQIRIACGRIMGQYFDEHPRGGSTTRLDIKKMFEKVSNEEMFMSCAVCSKLLGLIWHTIEALEGNSCRVGSVLSQYASLRKEMDSFASVHGRGKQEWKEASACAMQKLLEMWHSDVKDLWVLSYALSPENIRKRTADSTKACSPWELICRDGPMMLTNVFHTFASRIQPGEDLTRCDEQFSKYLAMTDELTEDVFVHPSAENDQLTWWKLVAPSVRELSDLSIRLLSMPATSACSERNWKSFTAHYVKSRPRLSVTTGEKLVFLATNCEEISDLKDRDERVLRMSGIGPFTTTCQPKKDASAESAMDGCGEEEADDIDMDEDLFSPRDAQLDQESDDDDVLVVGEGCEGMSQSEDSSGSAED
jgi:hypothetical protein